MQTTIHPAPERGQKFTLTAETAADRDLLDTIHMHGEQSIARIATHRTRDGQGYITTGMTVVVDRKHPQALEAKTARQLLSSFRDLCRLGLAEAAGYRHVGADAANPQAQEQLATSLEQLQLMLQTLGEVVLQHRAVLQEMQSAHGASCGEKAIVAQPAASQRIGGATTEEHHAASLVMECFGADSQEALRFTRHIVERNGLTWLDDQDAPTATYEPQA